MAKWSGISQFAKDDDNFVMLAAIDFGTTFSGYAFSFKTSQSDIKMNKNWGENLGFQSYKTPTSVLVDDKGEFVAFGFEAEEQYCGLVEEEKSGYQMFRHFKMMLHKSGVSRQSKLESTSGKKQSALEIFSMALRYLKTHLLELVGKMTANPPSPGLIKWVLTVPAIWSDEAKQFMREAAYRGGLINNPSSRKLLIALEPEAASLYCRSLDTEHFVMGESVKAEGFKPGVKYLVIDAGGGTIDITAHQVLPNGQVKELHAANGGAWGGTKVDENFVGLLKEVLGSKFIDTYHEKCPQPWLNLMTSFERAKKAVQPNGSSKIVIPLGWDMGNKYGEITGKNIEKVIKESAGKGVSFGNGSLIIKPDAVSRLFDPVMQNIVSHIRKLLQNKKLSGIDFFLLVGGFGECGFLQKAIKDNFGQKGKLLVPFEAQMSVIKGAIIFGHKPTDIKSRIAKKSYGNSYLTNYDSNIHDRKHLKVIDGVEKCSELFQIYVQKGSDVETDYSMELSYTPASEDQDGMTVQLYAIDRTCSTLNPEYVDTNGFEKIGQVDVEMPGYGKDRKVDVQVTFGGTEIQVSAVDRGSGKSAATAINFLTM